MYDCPLSMGRTCTYYEAAGTEREVLDDDAVVGRRNALHMDYLRWNYRRRVRSLGQDRDAVSPLLLLEPVPEPDVDLGSELVLAHAPEGTLSEPEAQADADSRDACCDPSAAPHEAPLAPVESVDAAAPVEAPEPVSRPEERYPGQRRSEDRRGSSPRRPAAAQAKPEPIEEEDEELAAITPADQGPRSIDELFATLPEAHLPEKRAQSKPAAGQRDSRRGRPGRTRSGGGRRRAGGGSAAGPAKQSPESSSGEASGSRRRRRRPRRTGDAEGQKSGPAKGADAGSSAGGSGTAPAAKPPSGPSGRPDGAGGGDAGTTGPRRRRRRRRKPRGDGAPPPSPDSS